jgi:hypothetical protein
MFWDAYLTPFAGGLQIAAGRTCLLQTLNSLVSFLRTGTPLMRT